jgi:predicted PurR-regulated permease PerM
MHPTPTQQRAMGVLVALAFVVVAWIASPVAAGLILGTLVAFMLYPLYRKIARRTRRPALAAALLTGAATTLVAGALVALVVILVVRGQQVVAASPALLDDASRLAARVPHAQAVIDRLRSTAQSAAPKLGAYAAVIMAAVYKALLAFFFMTLTTFAVLRKWPSLVRALEAVAPLPRRYTRRVAERLRETSGTVMVGTVVTGALEGVLAGIGYALFQVPQPMFFGAMTAVASLLPVLGSMFVWAPIGVYLMATGKTVPGILVLVWSVLVVNIFSEYVVRPRLVGGRGSMGFLPSLVALLGGIEIFGVSGLVLGPIVMAVALDMIDLYREDRALQRTQSAESRPVVHDGASGAFSGPWPASRLAQPRHVENLARMLARDRPAPRHDGRAQPGAR